jgi:organic radical activating enzyme
MKSIDIAPKSIGLIDVLADAVFRFIVDSEVTLDRRGKMLDELFRRAAPQYGLNWNGKTLPELNAKLTVIKKLMRKLAMSNPEVTQKRNSTRQQNKMIAATQAAMAAAEQAKRDAEWFKKQYTPSLQRNTKPTTSLE